jgi:hypothetical protein
MSVSGALFKDGEKPGQVSSSIVPYFFVMMIKLLPDGQVQGREQEEQHQEEQAH